MWIIRETRQSKLKRRVMALRLRSPRPWASADLGRAWPRFNPRWSGTGPGPAPTAALTHICHSRLGEEAALSEAPGQIRGISQRASISPGFPLWLMRKVGDGEEEDESRSG